MMTNVSEFVTRIIDGELFITTTDTVMGIGGKVTPQTKAAIFEIKQRPVDRKLVIVVANYEQARSFVSWTSLEEELAQRFWPGALTIVFDENTSLRMPADKVLLDLIAKTGPLYLSSCNLSGQPPCASLEQAKQIFGKQIKLFLDTKNTHRGKRASTIVFPKKNNKIIRQGDIWLW